MRPTNNRFHLYLRALWLWAHWRWLWTREVRYWPKTELWSYVHESMDDEEQEHEMPDNHISYRKGWTPAKFLLPYLTTYLLSVLLGHGIRPLSGVLWERAYNSDKEAKFHWDLMVSWVDKVLGAGHCEKSARAPLLWGSRGVWK